MKYLLDGVGKV